MEMTISNNYAMVPSYSEALLIQSPSESSFLLRRTPQPANATNGYYVPPTSAPLRSYTFSSLSSIMESSGGGSGYGSFIQGSYSSGFLSSIHPRESSPSGPSDCITANEEGVASSILSITVIPNVQNDELRRESTRSSNCRMYEEDQQRRRRRWRKRPKFGNSFFAPLGFGGSSSHSSTDYPDTITNTQSSVLPSTRGSSQTLATSVPLRCDDQSSSPNSEYCGGVIVNPLAVASSTFNRESTGVTPTTVEAPDAAENDDSTIYENINVTINSQISPTSSSDFLEDQNDTSSPITNTYINTTSIEIDDNDNDNNGITERASSTNSHAATSTTTTTAASFIAEPYNNDNNDNNNSNNNVPAIINSDIIEISCSNGCDQNTCRATGPQSGQLQSDADQLIESSSSTSMQQGYTEKPANTTGAAITVVVMDKTQKEDPSIELVQRSLVQQQLQLPEQQELPIAYNDLVRKKKASSDGGSRSCTTNGSCDSIDSISVSSSFRARGSRQDDTNSSIEYECEHGACACAAAGAGPHSMSKQNNNGQHQPLHLWAKNRNGLGLLGGSGDKNRKNNSNNTIKDFNNIPSPSSSSRRSSYESQPPVWVPRNNLDPYQHACQNKCRNPVFQNSSTMHSPSSRLTTHQQTLPPNPPSNQDESDPPPCYEDALWLKRQNTRYVNDDDDDYRRHRRRHRSNENSPSRNKRAHRTIQLKETSL